MFELWLARHGATEWSENGRHTGSRTDLPLLPEGERSARRLAELLRDVSFSAAYTSPLQRARRTAELAGFPDPEPTPLLLECDYGDYEGLTSEQIQESRPGWELYRDGCPGGEQPEALYRRARTFAGVAEARGGRDGRAIAFGHGHILRAVAAAWLALDVGAAAALELDTATLSVLVSGPRGRLLRLWNGRPA